ncbi:hypothetical protein HBN50_16185 [Halobacteriovorax sp. GB3]|uniref:hypothetical protein n=1 Tax=Halobacteriovorax sp. GB3 TaxID=2719615 RepID=UPI00235E5236|nr:hypothetical protein [Halobacteriovorax sp. GB3]MDD0854653.1 hypothetical protein [Halobacteriovorax sp. GB3]
MDISNEKVVLLLVVLIVITMLLLLTLVGLVVYYLFKNRPECKKHLSTTDLNPVTLSTTNDEPEWKKSAREISNTFQTPGPTASTGFCKNHTLIQSAGVCSICEHEFCQKCIKEIDKLHLCPEHFQLYIDHKWVPITNQLTTADTPEAGVYIYNFKKKLWDQEQTPSYILNEYKINVDNDYIETYVQLHVKDSDSKDLEERLKGFKSE